jgi:hypothetical protein
MTRSMIFSQKMLYWRECQSHFIEWQGNQRKVGGPGEIWATQVSFEVVLEIWRGVGSTETDSCGVNLQTKLNSISSLTRSWQFGSDEYRDMTLSSRARPARKADNLTATCEPTV